MNKAYTRQYWKNEPNTSTPLNENNLNKMDAALDTVDTRVVELYGYQERAEQAATDAETARVAAVFAKNDAQSANTSAQSAKTAAANSASAAATSATNANTSKEAAASSASAASASQIAAAGSASAAAQSKTDAAASATAAAGSATTASLQATAASGSATAAAGSASDALESKNAAAGSASDAAESYTDAAAKAKLAESYARGGTDSRSGEDIDNAKYYSEVAKAEADRASQAAGFDPADYVHTDGSNLAAVSGILADITAIINGTWTDT